MSPRAYRLGQRSSSSERTKVGILRAARKVILTSGTFTVDAIAREAGVSRMTVYYQFGSKVRLLEALFDDLADRGLMPQLPNAIGRPEPLDALLATIEAFLNFWASDRLVLRRIRAIAALDDDVGRSVRERDERRRQQLHRIVERLRGGGRHFDLQSATVDVLQMLTSFETFDVLCGEGHATEDVGRLVRELCLAAIAFKGE